MEQLGSNWTGFYEIQWLKIFWKYVEDIQVSLKSDESNGYFTWRDLCSFMIISPEFFLEWEIFQTCVVEKIRTHILCSIHFFSPQTSYSLWDNVEKCRAGQVTDDNTVWLMYNACWINKATDTHSEYVMYFHGNSGYWNLL
jgi:hypothetical protein